MGRKTPLDWLVPAEKVTNVVQAKYVMRRSLYTMNKRDELLAWMADGHGNLGHCREVAKLNRRIREFDRDLIAMGLRLIPPPKGDVVATGQNASRV